MEEQAILEKDMKFEFRHGIGELLFAAITCRPEILYAVIILSQFSTKPAEIHYNSVKQIFRYVCDTLDYGIHYWRPTGRENCLVLPFPEQTQDNQDVPPVTQKSLHEPYGYVDADWVGGVNTRKSVTGLAIILAGGSIAYRVTHNLLYDIVAQRRNSLPLQIVPRPHYTLDQY